MERESVLLELGRNARELGIECRADRIDSRNDHDRNAGGDQTIFNRGRAGFVLEKRENFQHVRTPRCYRQQLSAAPIKESLSGTANECQVFPDSPTAFVGWVL
jgi:hypothetical protein